MFSPPAAKISPGALFLFSVFPYKKFLIKKKRRFENFFSNRPIGRKELKVFKKPVRELCP